MASWAPGGDAGRRLALDAWPAALTKWDKNHDDKLAKTEVDDREVLDRFYRMDLDQSGLLDQKEWDRHADVFRRAENAMLALKPSGRGELKDGAVLWKYQRGVPYVSTPLLENGILWMVKDGGIVTKLDAASGRMLQEERLTGPGSYFASPVAGDGKVYFSSAQGVVSVLTNTADWQVISSHEFHEKIYATPVIDRDAFTCVAIRHSIVFRVAGSRVTVENGPHLHDGCVETYGRPGHVLSILTAAIVQGK